MNLEPESYSSEPMPLESLKVFLAKTLPVLGWNICSQEDIVLDAGCGPGGTTFHLVLPLFFKVKQIFAMDLVPAAIESAKKQNSHPLIEYSVANFEDWSTLQHWEGQITKLISVYCINWLKDQRNAFQNIFRLLTKGGEAAVCFPMQTSYYDALLKVQNNPKWSGFLKGAETLIPESHYKKYDSSLYIKMAEEIGFEIIYCRDELVTDVIPSEEKYRNFFPASCVLIPHIPVERRGEFKNDFIEELIKENGRNNKGLPQFRSRIIELVIRKN